MIDFLRGRVVHREPDCVVLDVHDVGYRVFTPNPYALALNGEPVQLFVHHHVREDAMLLYGFPTREEQALFRLLLDVPGVGPKVALGILANGRPEAIAAAIREENVAFLTRLPGIGKKTAQRLILDLKDKVGAFTGGAAGAPGEAAAAWAAEPSVAANAAGDAWAVAREALLGLGYREAELERAWTALRPELGGEETPDQLIRLALQRLFKG